MRVRLGFWLCLTACAVAQSGQTGRALLNVSVAAGATYVLPLGGGPGSQQGFNVDWGDGSGNVKCTNDGLPCQYTYTNAGFYLIKITGRALGWSMLYAPGSRCHNRYPAVWTDAAGRSCATYEAELRYDPPREPCAQFPTSTYAGLGGLGAAEACCACGGGAPEPAEAAGAALVAITDWGRIELHPTAGRHLQNLAALRYAAPLPAQTGLTSLHRSFSGLASLALDVSALDTSTVTNVSYAFAESRGLAVLGLGAWDVSAVVDASFAFADTGASSAFPGVELWQTASLLDATAAFNYATAFVADLAAWDVRGLRRWDFLLQGASEYTHGLAAWAPRLPPGDRAGACLWALAGTRVREADRAALCGSDFVMTVFAEYDPSPRAPELSYLDPAPLAEPAHTFTVDWGDGSPLQTCVQAPGAASCAKTSGPYAVGARAHIRIRGALHGLRHLGYDGLWLQAIHSWGNVSLTTTDSSFQPARQWQTVQRNRLFYYGPGSSLSYLSYLAPIAGTQALRYVDAFHWFLSGAQILVGDLRDWDLPFVGSFGFLLADAWRLDQPLPWNTTAVTSLYRTFSSARAFNGDVSGWDVGRVTSLVSTFFDAGAFNCDISGWRVRADARTDYLLDFACAFRQNLSAWPVAAAVARCA